MLFRSRHGSYEKDLEQIYERAGQTDNVLLLYLRKVAAEPTDELYFLKASALVVRFLSSNARFKGVNLAPGGEGGKFLLFKNFSDEM